MSNISNIIYKKMRKKKYPIEGSNFTLNEIANFLADYAKKNYPKAKGISRTSFVMYLQGYASENEIEYGVKSKCVQKAFAASSEMVNYITEYRNRKNNNIKNGIQKRKNTIASRASANS